MDIEANVFTENLTNAIKKHACTAYLNFVNINKHGKPTEIPKKIIPSTEYQKRLWQESEQRKSRRFERVKKIKMNMASE
jgi:acyl-CoA hydrolase